MWGSILNYDPGDNTALLRHFWLFALTVLPCFLVFMGDIVITAKRRSQATVRWAWLLWKYPRYSVPFFRWFWQFSSLPYRLRTLFTSSLAFSVFQVVFWRECLQCCQQYCSAVTVWLCRVFLCYIELHGTVPVGFLCSHWILAFPQTLTFSAYLWSWQAPFHFLPLSYWENCIFLLIFKTLWRLSFALGLVQLTAVQVCSAVGFLW